MIRGIFKKEHKHRFLCQVLVDKKSELCYVANSSHFSDLISLENKKVLLRANKGKNLKTRYTLYAVNSENTNIRLDLKELNNIFFQYLKDNKKYLPIKKEYIISGYKTDFYIEKTKQVYEIKGVLSKTNIANYTFKDHNRAYNQLQKIKYLLSLGYKINFVFILLNPKIDTFILSDKRLKENKLFLNCIKSGLKVCFYKTYWDKNIFKIKNVHPKTNF
ncbi:DNA/RNA nuclease SfsA [bacterium]|nr:DNA/RNA nuclease SfsA [bacterium]